MQGPASVDSSLKLRDIFPGTCEPIARKGDREEQLHSSRVGELLCNEACREMFHVYQRLGRGEEAKKIEKIFDACAETQGIWLEAVGWGVDL
jgi:hypothetical protein